MMYEELVANLREHAEWDKAGIWVIPITIIDDLRKAADAIEVLNCDIDLQKNENKALYNAFPKWIPVTERLPKINSDMYSDDLIVCMRRFDGEGYYYEKFAGYLTSSNIWYTYQHDNCSQVGVEQHMKHHRETADVIVAWMPMPSLPEPPKEKHEVQRL